MGQQRAAKRYKWRLPCEVVYEGHAHRALVIDLSTSGLFVQTATRFLPGSEVEVRVRLEETREPISLRTRVARNKQVPSQLTSLARGGIGLRIVDAPRAYYDAIATLNGGESLRGQLNGAAPSEPPPVALPKPRFRVRIKQTDGPRSRSIEVRAESAEIARKLALSQAGKGWEAVAAEPIG